MKPIKLLLIFIVSLVLLAPWPGRSQGIYRVLTADTFDQHFTGYPLVGTWEFSKDDDRRYSDIGFQAQGFVALPSDFIKNKTLLQQGPIWGRLIFSVDSSLVKRPLALKVLQSGASEIYVDGNLLVKYGEIRSNSASVYINPQELPFVFTLDKAGRHLIAVRYENRDASRNQRVFGQEFSGFSIKLGLAQNLIRTEKERTLFYTFTCLLMVGIFLSLFISHLFLYLYHPENKANLFFMLFCLGLIGSLLIPYLSKVCTDQDQLHFNVYAEFVVKGCNCFALCGFVNEIFSKVKLRFQIISFASLAIVVTSFIVPEAGTPLFYVLLLAVSLEAVILIFKAIARKQKGAKILGIGIFIFICFLAAYSIIKIKYNLKDEDLEAQAFGKTYILFISFILLSLPVSMSTYIAYTFSELNKSLANSNKKLRELISFNAHQIREPLTRITGAMHVREFVDTHEEFMQDYMPLMEKAAHDLDNAIKDLLERAQNKNEEEVQ